VRKKKIMMMMMNLIVIELYRVFDFIFILDLVFYYTEFVKISSKADREM
jgi:hypothetical protein